MNRLQRFLKLYLSSKPTLVHLYLAIRSIGRSAFAATQITNPYFSDRTILFVDGTTPRSDRDAGALSIVQFMELFAAHGWQVHLWPFDQEDLQQQQLDLQRKGIQVVLFSRYAGAFKIWMKLHSCKYKVIFVSRPALAAYLRPWLSRCTARTAYYGHDLHGERFRQEAKLTGHHELRLLSRHFTRLEREICATADYSYYPSAEEVDIMHAELPHANIKEVPPYAFNLADLPAPQPPAGADVLFVGNFSHLPNLDAAHWLLDDLWPCIRKRLTEDARLILAGARPPKSLARKANDSHADVTVTGWVSDQELIGFYQSCRVVLVPLRFGAGVKHKLVSAVIQGCPVVTTDVGLQGLPELKDMVGLAHNSMEFTLECERLIVNDDLWLSRASSARRALSTRFSRKSMWTALRHLHHEC